MEPAGRGWWWAWHGRELPRRPRPGRGPARGRGGAPDGADGGPSSDALDDDVDRLSHVIRSLEAEIGDVAVGMVDDEGVTGASGEDGVMLEDMLLDLDHHEGGLSFGCWPEVSLIGHEAEANWYVYSNGYEGGVVGYQDIDHQYQYQYHCCAVEGSVEQVYSPLWE